MKKISVFYMLGASMAALTAMPSMAQEAETPAAQTDSYEPPVIIVEARRRGEDVQDVPAVINAVTAESINNLNFRQFNEVQSLAPGLELSTNANGIGGNARLRGVNFDANASGNSGTVEFYFNDAPISPGIILQQMYDIGQIEVQRGPQGTLRGRASPSGSITIATRKPDLNEFGGFVDMTGNDIGTINVKGALNLPIIEGIAAIRVSGLWDENEGDRVRPINSSFGGVDPHSRTKSGRIVAAIEPTDWIKLEGTYQYMDRAARTYDQAISFSEVNPGATPSPILITAKDRLSIQEQARTISQRFDIYNWRSEFSAAGQRLIYQGQYSRQEFHSTDNVDRANLFVGRDVNQVTNTIAKGTTHEIRLQNDERVLGMFDYVVGFFDSKLNPPTSLTSPTIVRLPVAFGGGIAQVVQTPISRTGTSHEQSFFGNLTAHIGESTELSGGVRQISYTSENFLTVNGATIAADRQDADKLIYSASVKHNFSSDFLVYAATGSSFRPGINVVGDFNIAQSPLEQSFLNLPPETSKSYEVGFKSTLMDGKMRFNLTAYHQKYKNFPFRVPNNGVYYVNTVALRDAQGNVTGTAQQVNSFNFVGAVPVEVNGVEGELAFDVSDNWNIGLVASYALGKIKNGAIPCNDLNGDGVPDAVGAAPTLAQLQAAVGTNNLSSCDVTQRSAFLPPVTATLQSEYKLAVSNSVDGFVRGLLNYNGKSMGDPGNNFDDVGAYSLLNLYTGIRDPDGAWEVSLFAKNLLNTTKVLSRTTPLFTAYQQLGFAGQFDGNGRPVFTGPTAGTTTSTYTGGTLTPPREFGLNVRFFFGSR
ncbi:TonB-dependent receptor [Sphingobium boeckii]|uniref:Iron complex outermembrane receptor protein n=1 Tax=Sphingobium boeckii TaxID=1082345 RepID=A0A7W9EEZ0_9SPHN|nr:TonB-dependent receptor plug domain-containing protein [Sphingobium boeckii]MBB5686763.1 iron complex outermembrane receptor protein [Sphingobium boeckii]